MDKAPDAFRTISEVAEDLDLPQHVLRFWETRFAQIKPMKRGGGRRYYRPEDVDVLRGIRHLLYGEGYTIRGVQRIFKDHGIRFVQTVWQVGAPQPAKTLGDSEEAGGGTTAPETGGLDRGRRLFGILPTLMGNGEDASEHDKSERHESSTQHAAEHRSPPRMSAPPDDRRGIGERLPFGAPTANPQPIGSEGSPITARNAGLPRDAIGKLQTTLTELTECRRLLDAVLQEKAEA